MYSKEFYKAKSKVSKELEKWDLGFPKHNILLNTFREFYELGKKEMEG